MSNQVAIFLPSRSGNVSEDLDGNGCGAREQVADWLAYHLALKGKDVHIFTNQEKSVHKRRGVYGGGTHYVDNQMAAPMLTTYDWDALVTFDYPNVAAIPNLKDNVGRVIMAQNYFSFPPNGEVPPEYFQFIDAFVYPSEWARDECSLVSEAPLDKAVVIPYTWDERFFSVDREGDGKRFIYASQAESGLAQMLRMWPDILAQNPGYMLTVACQAQEFVDQVQWSHHYQSQLALDIRDLIDQPGVRYIGRQGRAALAREMAEADALLYPAEPLMPAELGSLPIIQSIASGCLPFVTDVDALGELYDGIGMVVDGKGFAEDVFGPYGPPGIPSERFPTEVFERWQEVLGC